MAGDASEQIQELLQMLASDNLNDRLTAIQVLGDVGDENALHALRDRMTAVNKELQTLVIIHRRFRFSAILLSITATTHASYVQRHSRVLSPYPPLCAVTTKTKQTYQQCQQVCSFEALIKLSR